MATLLSEVRLRIYHFFIETGRAPSASEIATELGLSTASVEAAYRQMGEEHVLVLHPGTFDIWMAMPFSAVPTPYRVTVGERWWYANCAWDALGIPALLGSEAQIVTDCPDCAEPLTIQIEQGTVSNYSGVVHFAVPAAHWWDDIGFT
jgi:DNA-binding transcriptional MocR family regulator